MNTTPKQLHGKVWRVLANDGDAAVELENKGVFDELVVDRWLHIEQMDHNRWWMRVGDARILIVLDDTGKATVDIHRGLYEDVKGTTKLYYDPDEDSPETGK